MRAGKGEDGDVVAAAISTTDDLDDAAGEDPGDRLLALRKGVIRQTLDYCRVTLFQAPGTRPRQLALPWLGQAVYDEEDLYCALPSAADRPPRSGRSIGRDRFGEVLIVGPSSHDPTMAQAAMLAHWRSVFRREMERPDHEPLQVEHATVWRCYMALDSYDGELILASNLVRERGDDLPTMKKLATKYGKSERQVKRDLDWACWALAGSCYRAHRRRPRVVSKMSKSVRN